MMADAEVIAVAAEVLSDLKIGAFTIKLNHRGILDSVSQGGVCSGVTILQHFMLQVMAISGVPPNKFRSIW